MKKMSRIFLAAALGVSALWVAAPASAATGNIEVPPVAKSDLTAYAYLQGAPIQTAEAPGSYLRDLDTFIVDEVTYEDGEDRIFRISEPFTADDGSEWRAVSRWWKDEGTRMKFEPMFIPEQAVKKILTEEEYYATFLPEGSESESPSAEPTVVPGAQAASQAPQAVVQQEATEEKGTSPLIPGIIGLVVVAAAAGAYLAMRRKKQAGTESNTEAGR